jgi:hypothetical protein
MGVVKLFSNSGGSPTPPTYLNYVGNLAGSFANEQGLDGTQGEIIIPLNNVSISTNPNNPKNVTSVDFANSGQDISFYIVGANIVISNADRGVTEFTGKIFVDGVEAYTRTFEIDTFGIMDMVLDSAVSVSSSVYVSLTTDNTSFDIVSSNWLFYSTGNIIPPISCEYFQDVASVWGIAQCTINGLLPSQTSTPTNFPIVAQGNAWRTSIQFGNYRPRFRYITNLNSDPTATLLDGEIYYVEATLSQTCVNDFLLYFGVDGTELDIANRVNFDARIDGSLTTPQGFYLTWNTRLALTPFFLFGLDGSLSVANAYNGTITFNIGTQNCPI